MPKWLWTHAQSARSIACLWPSLDTQYVVLDGATLNPGDNPWTAFEELGQLVIHDRTPDQDVLERSRGAAVLVVNKVRIGRARIEELPELELIAVSATGYDCVDTRAARGRGVAD